MGVTKELEVVAFKAGNGELAWPRETVGRAIREIAASGEAVLGGEVWLVKGSTILAAVPQQEGPPAVCGWTVEKGSLEPWAEFCRRSESESLRAVESLPGDGAVIPNFYSVVFNLTRATREEFDALR